MAPISMWPSELSARQLLTSQLRTCPKKPSYYPRKEWTSSEWNNPESKSREKSLSSRPRYLRSTTASGKSPEGALFQYGRIPGLDFCGSIFVVVEFVLVRDGIGRRPVSRHMDLTLS